MRAIDQIVEQYENHIKAIGTYPSESFKHPGTGRIELNMVFISVESLNNLLREERRLLAPHP